MPTIRDHINKVEAYGTSEGAEKGWETRKGGGSAPAKDQERSGQRGWWPKRPGEGKGLSESHSSIRRLDGSIKNLLRQAKSDEDSEMRRMYARDAKDLQKIRTALVEGKFSKAARMHDNLDTAVRDIVRLPREAAKHSGWTRIR